MSGNQSVLPFSKNLMTIRAALISVSNKVNLGVLAPGLRRHNVRLISTGGTAARIQEVGCSVDEVKDLTGFPEMLEGRVKTLHPQVHAGLLARHTSLRGHAAALKKAGITPIDLAVVNLYPFVETVVRPKCTLEEAFEEIDIGGQEL